MTFATDTVGESAQAAVAGMSDGDVVLLENLRFNPGETAKTDDERAEFADALAGLADAYVSDGFGVVHRKQASVYDVATRLPAAMGGLVHTEVDVLKRLTEDPERPYAVVLGGAKVADKLAVIDNLMTTADRLLIGGGMLFTFLAAQGHEIGTSLFDADSVEACKGYLERAEETGVEIVLPVDVVCGREFSADTETVTVAADAIPADMMGLDIGPRSAELYAEKVADTRTVFWNGPMGAFEMAPFAAGTRRLARGARRGHREGCADRGRRRRLRRGRAPARLRRRPVRPHLHRRRRLARVPRGQGTARHRHPVLTSRTDRSPKEHPWPPAAPRSWRGTGR